MAPLQIQNWEHGADACDLGEDADVCVDASSPAVVAAGHGCGRDGLKPSGRRTFRSGLEVDDDYPERPCRTLHLLAKQWINKLLNKLLQFLLCTIWTDKRLFDCRV
jgi:hypothetical protein